MGNHSGRPASTVEATADRASQGGLDCPGAPGTGAQTVRHRSPSRSGAGSSAGPTREPVPSTPRAATRLATTVSTTVRTTGLNHGWRGRSSATELNSSPVSSSREVLSTSPATLRYRSESTLFRVSAAIRRLFHHGGRSDCTSSPVPGRGSIAAVRRRRARIRPGWATKAPSASTSSQARPGTLPKR